ncbi:MAG TPA: hypothetical protein VMJ49_09375 [Gaiellaceae bacterium]|nr:hypothetical protein [Gaiellaceae bacterium]
MTSGASARTLVALSLGAALLALSACGGESHSRSTAFGTSGVVRTDFGGDDRVSTVVSGPNGTIVAVGGSGDRFALARYRRDGSLDPSFGMGGKVVTNVGVSAPNVWPRDGAVAAAAQPDGKIVVTGGLQQFVLARYLRNGRLDPSFGDRGIVRTSFGNPCSGQDYTDEPDAVAVEANGTIVVAGRSCYDVALARYLPNGRLDTSFGGDGKVVTHVGGDDFSSAVALAAAPDRTLTLAVSVCCHMGEYSRIVGLTATGHRTFEAEFKLADFNDVSALALEPDGASLAGGSGQYVDQVPPGASSVRYGIVRLTTTGRLDPAFAKGGTLLTDPVFPAAIAIAPDGRIVVAGDRWLARYTDRGALDKSFGTGGTQRTAFPPAVTALALRGDGTIVVAGNAGTAHKHDFMLARYTADGKLDS